MKSEGGAGRDALGAIQAKSEAARAEIARTLGQRASDTPADVEALRALAHALAVDVSERVRHALAVTLCRSPVLPREVALALAMDVGAVAVPVLEFCAALSEADLLDLSRATGDAQRCALARRCDLTSPVVASLIEEGNVEVSRTLAGNQAAPLRAVDVDRMLTRFADAEVCARLGARCDLPPDLLATLIAWSARLLVQGIQGRGAGEGDLDRLAADAQGYAVLELARRQANSGRAVFLRGLVRRGVVDARFLALCVRERATAVLTTAAAVLADIPEENAAQLLKDASGRGTRALLERCGADHATAAAILEGVSECDGWD